MLPYPVSQMGSNAAQDKAQAQLSIGKGKLGQPVCTLLASLNDCVAPAIGTWGVDRISHKNSLSVGTVHVAKRAR